MAPLPVAGRRRAKPGLASATGAPGPLADDPAPAGSPGEALRAELAARGLRATALAAALKVPPNRITEILRGRRGISAETAMRLARHLGGTPGHWLDLQKAYELELAEAAMGPRIRREVKPWRRPAES
jgi:addiction module HigA family antidote